MRARIVLGDGLPLGVSPATKAEIAELAKTLYRALDEAWEDLVMLSPPFFRGRLKRADLEPIERALRATLDATREIKL